MDRLAEFVIRRPGPILVGTVLLTLAGGYLTLQNRVNDEAVKYFSTQTEYRQAVDLLEEKAIKNPYFKKAIEKNKQLIYG